MTPEELARAVERVRNGRVGVADPGQVYGTEIAEPLAELIEAGDEYLRLAYRFGSANREKFQQALAVLVRVINGEGER